MLRKHSSIYGFWGTSWVLITMAPRNRVPCVNCCFFAILRVFVLLARNFEFRKTPPESFLAAYD